MTMLMEPWVHARPAAAEDEWQQRLDQWNDTSAEFPQVCAHELFEQQAACNPEAVAIAFGSQKISYRELNQRANKVAHHLRRLA